MPSSAARRLIDRAGTAAGPEATRAADAKMVGRMMVDVTIDEPC